MTKIVPRFQSEKHFQGSVERAARALGWKCYHTHNSRHSSAGFPDIVAVKDGEILYAELKMPKGKVTEHQRAWLEALQRAGQRTYLWKPSDWDSILTILQSGEDDPENAHDVSTD